MYAVRDSYTNNGASSSIELVSFVNTNVCILQVCVCTCMYAVRENEGM